MDDSTFVRRFTEALRPGSYLRIVVEGDVGAGDEINVIHVPDHGMTVRDVFRIYTRDRGEAERLIAIPQMSESWKKWAENLLEERKQTRTLPSADAS
jgi:MOSC domain-containing protein YiiM